MCEARPLGSAASAMAAAAVKVAKEGNKKPAKKNQTSSDEEKSAELEKVAAVLLPALNPDDFPKTGLFKYQYQVSRTRRGRRLASTQITPTARGRRRSSGGPLA